MGRHVSWHIDTRDVLEEPDVTSIFRSDDQAVQGKWLPIYWRTRTGDGSKPLPFLVTLACDTLFHLVAVGYSCML